MFAVAPKPLLEYFDGPVEVVAERQQQVDVVEVPTATEAVSQVVARVHCLSGVTGTQKRRRLRLPLNNLNGGCRN